MKRQKFFIATTVGRTLFFFAGQPRLWREQFDVMAISGEKEKLVEFAKQEEIDYRYMPMHREISLRADVFCLLRFIWLFLKERPYIVHGNTPKASVLSMVAAWLTRRPVRIYMCHGLRYQTAENRLRRILMSMEWLACYCATEVICVSKGVKEVLISDGLCPSHKAKVVHHGTAGGVNIDYFSRTAIPNDTNIRLLLSIPNDAFVFCFVGRIVRDKGINELVSAFNRLSQDFKHIHLLLVGPAEKDLDPINEHSEMLISCNSHIHAVGYQNDVRSYLVASNAFVLPSYREGVGMVLLEANAMDIPCIASDIAGCRDVIEPLINGELVESHNENALYEKMKEWIENPKKTNNMARLCRKHVLSRYAHKDVAKAYANEYARAYHERLWLDSHSGVNRNL